jgi:hypothetical protein
MGTFQSTIQPVEDSYEDLFFDWIKNFPSSDITDNNKDNNKDNNVINDNKKEEEYNINPFDHSNGRDNLNGKTIKYVDSKRQIIYYRVYDNNNLDYGSIITESNLDKIYPEIGYISKKNKWNILSLLEKNFIKKNQISKNKIKYILPITCIKDNKDNKDSIFNIEYIVELIPIKKHNKHTKKFYSNNNKKDILLNESFTF